MRIFKGVYCENWEIAGLITESEGLIREAWGVLNESTAGNGEALARALHSKLITKVLNQACPEGIGCVRKSTPNLPFLVASPEHFFSFFILDFRF